MSGEAKPYSKAQQLARGERRYRRKVASPKQWQAIFAAKGNECRLAPFNVQPPLAVTYHHLIPRDQGGGDVANNIIPLCQHDHTQIELRQPEHVRALLASLTDAEYAYAVGKAGEDFAERIYGLRYVRA